MAEYDPILDSEIDPESPITSTLMSRMRDNPEAIAEGASGATRVQAEGIAENAVLSRIATDTTAGAIGTYAFAWLNSTSMPPSFGATVSGGSLRPAGFTTFDSVSVFDTVTYFSSSSTIYASSGLNAPVFSGTWMCMGEATQQVDDSGNYPHTLWLRIA